MEPLSYEIQAVSSCTPQHIGLAIPEVGLFDTRLYNIFTSIYGTNKLGNQSSKQLYTSTYRTSYT